ncbi:MAG: MerR family transcriptional regulator [Gemmatimonadaceae bacterium]
MADNLQTFDLNELSDQAGVTSRTVRYYIQQGLLSSPEARGPGTRYGRSHLDRLNLIKRLQREHLPLAEIRRRLEKLDDRAVRELLRTADEQPKSSALSYVREVLAGGRATRIAESLSYSRAAHVSPAPPPGGGERSQWERIRLAPDVELHVRRPLSREQNKLVDSLIELAHNLFSGDKR